MSEKNFVISSEQPIKKYDLAIEFIMEKFGGHNGLEKVVADRMKSAEAENIPVGTKDFTNFVLGYCSGELTENALDRMGKIIGGIVKELEELKELGIESEDRKKAKEKVVTEEMIKSAKWRQERGLGIDSDDEV